MVVILIKKYNVYYFLNPNCENHEKRIKHLKNNMKVLFLLESIAANKEN